MVTHSNILAWRIPWTKEPGGLLSIGWHRVRQERSNLAHTHVIGEKCIGRHVFVTVPV